MSDERAIDAMLAEALSDLAGGAPLVSLTPRGWVSGDYGDPSDSERGSASEGMLLVLETVGLLSKEAAQAWRARFALAAEGWGAAPPAASQAETERAEAFLDSLLAELAASEDASAKDAVIDRLNGAFSLFLNTGVVRAEDAPAWGRRLEAALGKTVEEFELVDIAGVDPDELDELDEDDEPAVGRGRALRMVPALLERHDGLCVTAAELYEHGFALYWHLVTSGRFRPDSFDQDKFEVADDVGTRYGAVAPSSAGWSERKDGPFAVLGESWCATPVPEAATELRVSKAGAGWRVPLGRPAPAKWLCA